MVFPFLLLASVQVFSAASTTGDIIHGRRSTHPGQPCTTRGPKGEVPSWLEGLEVLVRLEEGLARADGVHDTQDYQAHKNVYCVLCRPMLGVRLVGSMG